MEFKKYPKIRRLGTEETEGILEGTCFVQEKIDGANASIWMEDGVIHCGSRNNDLTKNGNPFNGFVEYVKNHEGITKLFKKYPDVRLYGEWLVKHTIQYDETKYKEFYLFDIEYNEDFLQTPEVELIAYDYNIKHPVTFATYENPTEEDINKFVGKSFIGDKGEGVVIKNPDFTNKFDDKQYAKIVTQDFKERNAITFGGNNKHSETYWEMWVCNKYITLPRVKKIIQKIESEHGRVTIELTPRVANTVYHDMITEEIWEISKKAGTINFKSLSRVCTKKAIQIFHDILNNSISVNDKE